MILFSMTLVFLHGIERFEATVIYQHLQAINHHPPQGCILNNSSIGPDRDDSNT
jgi:hypothetical protein